MGPESLDLINMVKNASLMVQFVLLALLSLSVSSWAIIIVKYRYIRQAYRQSADFTEFFWESRDFAEAFVKAKELQGSPIARIFRIGYSELKRLSQSGAASGRQNSESKEGEDASLENRFIGSDNIKRSLRRSASAEITKMTQMVPFLATTSNTAPFIGLFGTVWGIMNSFHGIGMLKSASLAVVAPGITEALVATAFGLLVAIPAAWAFNYFMNKIRVIESEMNNFSSDFLNIVERDFFLERRRSR
jgi:biopolymer transport protein TolQ